MLSILSPLKGCLWYTLKLTKVKGRERKNKTRAVKQYPQKNIMQSEPHKTDMEQIEKILAWLPTWS